MAILLPNPLGPTGLGPLFRPAPRPALQPAATDSYAGAVPSDPGKQLQAHAQEQKRRAASVASMLDTSGPGAPTPDQKQALISHLSIVDSDVLGLAERHGVKIGVVDPGDDITRVGAFKPVDVNEMQRNMPHMRELADRAAAAGAAVDRKQAAALKAVPEPQGKAQPQSDNIFATSLNETALEQQKILLDARKERAAAVGDALNHGRDGVVPFRIPSTSKEEVGFGVDPNAFLSPIMNTDMMATAAGAKTPEERREYAGLVQGINGERLQKAQGEQIANFEKSIPNLPADQQASAREHLAQWKKDPSGVPFEMERNGIFAPDLYYARDKEGNTVRLNGHDYRAYKEWNDGASSAADLWTPKSKDSTGTLINGEYFTDTKKFLVHSGMLSGEEARAHTAVHELGHAMEDIVKQKDPQFYEGWQKRLNEAHGRAAGPPPDLSDPASFTRKPPGSVSDYALTNPGEYFAEGFSHYYDDPKLLQTKDPALFGLTREFVEHARTLK